jgi:hypothetical protein
MSDLDNLKKCREIIRDWPITIERYDSGRFGFITRPQINNKRLNKSFSTTKYESNEEAAKAAVEYCKQCYRENEEHFSKIREEHPIPDSIRPELSRLVNQCLQIRIDPLLLLRDAIKFELKRRFQI